MSRIKESYWMGGGVIIAVIINVGILFYFKYYNFFIDNINSVFKSDFNLNHIGLPLGISFFTFQQISYAVDSYYNKTSSYTFLEYALFVTFFPQLIAGPIVLHDELIPQFRDPQRKRLNCDNITHGIMWFLCGLIKKIIIADTLGKAAGWAFLHYDVASSADLIIGIISYTFQIYFDFSSYSDMACGIARMFNIVLPQNFNSPYKALSIIDFWQRWHMTLTRFLRQYIYFPLGGSKKGKLRTYINIMVIFLASGIWHGANWTFIFWGLLHGIANIITRLFKKNWEKMHVVFQWSITFFLVNIGWVFFRAENMGKAFSILKKVVSFHGFSLNETLVQGFILPECRYILRFNFLNISNEKFSQLYMFIVLFICFWLCLNVENNNLRRFKRNSKTLMVSIMAFIWVLISLSGVSEFLYFNF